VDIEVCFAWTLVDSELGMSGDVLFVEVACERKDSNIWREVRIVELLVL